MFPLETLDVQQMDWCLRTISSNAFYLLVGDALSRKKSLSVVRMADGELTLWNDCRKAMVQERLFDFVKAPGGESEEWNKRYGIEGIKYAVLWERLYTAAHNCTYFAPSISGVHLPNYRTYGIESRAWYVDNFFPNAWDTVMKINLYRKAGHVLFIHRSRGLADALQIRCKYALGVQVTYLELSNWDQADSVIAQTMTIDAPLVIFSAGPASKYIGPIIASSGKIPKVTLDIGQAAERWALPSLMDLPQVKGRYVKLIE